MEQWINVAGTVVRVIGPDTDLAPEPGMLAPFLVPPTQSSQTMTIQLTDTLPQPAGECIFNDPARRVYRDGDATVTYIGSVARSANDAYIHVVRRGNHRTVWVKCSAVPDRIHAKTILTAMEAEHIIVQNGGFLLHASCIAVDGEAILFTAPSGTGKSTQADLWAKYRGAEIINGDRIAVCLNENGAEARGIPFAGSSGICKSCALPLRAIIHLGQAPTTTVTRLNGVRAFRCLWEGCSVYTWDRTDVARCVDTVQQVLARVPVYHMDCTPDEAAVTALEAVLRKG